MQQFVRAAAVLAGTTICLSALAADGPLGIDHRLQFDDRAIWLGSKHRVIQAGSAAVVLGGALWEGSESRLGRTFWKAGEAMVLGDAAAEVLKRTFRRTRPIQGGPNDWFGTSGHRSFPSGEVTHITAVVTPFIAEYGREAPAVWALAALPAYVAVGRLKRQAHWQADVLAGAALGAGMGYHESTRDSAWTFAALPRGVTVGLRKQF